MSNTSPLNIVVAAGGTGGHIFPAVAVVEQLTALTGGDVDVTFIGSADRMEARLIPDLGYRFVPIKIKGLGRLFSVDTLMMPVRVARSVVQSYLTLKKRKAAIVLCTGAYISFPVGIAAWLAGIPLVVFESNVNPGKSNKKLAPKASAVIVAFEETKRYFSSALHKKLICLGNPIRSGVSSDVNAADARVKLGLDQNKKTLLVFGGSLGSRTINQATEKFTQSVSGVQVIWQTGKNYQPPQGLPSSVLCTEFVTDMGLAYAAADVVVCRSGATTIAELALVGKPCVLVPLPSASTNEQHHNAVHAERAGGAVVVNDNQLQQSMESLVLDILNDDEKIKKMGEAMKSLGRPNAAIDSAKLTLELVGWSK